ncbi:hypothetical protein [Methanosarcina sp.]|uniref:hypothetical protein n=1 Tax=Methanosarcina sp. TaxID=2213 RepID=UPI002AB9A314|nr:hypothetical protein [Methanosarcina sp.]MDY9925855.1 hypothetical protein [Methanosarcina sp.]
MKNAQKKSVFKEFPGYRYIEIRSIEIRSIEIRSIKLNIKLNEVLPFSLILLYFN